MDFLTFDAYITEYPAAKWLIFAAVLIIIETSIIPGIGAFFAALGALTLGGLMVGGVLSPNSFLLEVAWFFGFTTAWAAALWIPLKKHRGSTPAYNEYRGTHAEIVKGPIEKGKLGYAKWSGAEMRARLRDESTEESIAEGTEIWVWGIKSSALIVDTASPNDIKE